MERINSKDAPKGFKAIAEKPISLYTGCCEGCYFTKRPSCPNVTHKCYCNEYDRADKCSVIFVKIKKPVKKK